jgi:hypothetical protein
MLPALSVEWQDNPHGDVPSVNSGRWPWLRGDADACFKSRNTACAFITKSRRGPLAALPGAGVWRYAWGDSDSLSMHVTTFRIPIATHHHHHHQSDRKNFFLAQELIVLNSFVVAELFFSC